MQFSLPFSKDQPAYWYVTYFFAEVLFCILGKCIVMFVGVTTIASALFVI